MRVFRGILLIFALIAEFSAEAGEYSIWKMFPSHEKSFLITSDFQIWELCYLKPTEQTWYEWLSGSIPEQPDKNFYIEQKGWKEGATLSIKQQSWADSWERTIYRNDQKNLLSCTYLIENTQSLEKVYAKIITIEDFITSFFDALAERNDLNKKLDEEGVAGLDLLNKKEEQYLWDLYSQVSAYCSDWLKFMGEIITSTNDLSNQIYSEEAKMHLKFLEKTQIVQVFNQLYEKRKEQLRLI